jgi:hypothetical protein
MALRAVGTRDWRTATDHDNVHEKAVWIGGFRAMPDFSAVADEETARVSAGSAVNVTVSVARVGGFEDSITVALQDAPKGITADPVTTFGADASMRIRVGKGVAAGRYTLTLTSTGADVERTSTIVIRVLSTDETSALNASLVARAGGF